MSNSISFVGRLAADSEMKQLGGTTVLEFRAANNTGFGEREVTNWFSCKIWGKRGEKLENMLRKGQQVFITGELSLKPWTNRDGVEKLSAEINVNNLDFVGSKDKTVKTEAANPDDHQATTAPEDSGRDTDSDELPF